MPDGLALAEHAGGVDEVTVLAGQQVSSAQEDCKTMGLIQALPNGLCSKSSLNGLLNELRGGLAEVAEDLGSVAGAALFALLLGVVLLSANNNGDIRALALQLDNGVLNLLGVLRARCI